MRAEVSGTHPDAVPVDDVRDLRAAERSRRLVRDVEAVGEEPRETTRLDALLQRVHPEVCNAAQ